VPAHRDARAPPLQSQAERNQLDLLRKALVTPAGKQAQVRRLTGLNLRTAITCMR
jgi:hypothetical protein